ncbi:MAG: hypothetical protein J6Y85_04910, partial [Alphaproteobacteria bacterium]|nr:hypothetical protein [Alphaproteobacteria bacterium]
GGTWITAHSATDEGCDAAHCNGLNFCRSAQKMNFFSALIWCKSIGHKLVDIDTACPNSISSQKCQNLKIGLSSTLFWSSMPSPYKDGQTVYFRADSGIDLDGKKNTDAVFALCKE